jgi:hypothetical protein
MPLILDHSIVGQSATTLTIRKDREFAACRICGDIFQPRKNIETPDEAYTDTIMFQATIEIRQWRNDHNLRHPPHEHILLAQSGLTMTPEAAHKLAPFGLVPVADVDNKEVADALREAPRAPVDDVETTLKGYR